MVLSTILIFTLNGGVGVSSFAQDGADWRIGGTFFAEDIAPYALLENGKRGLKKWVQVGDFLEKEALLVTRIERSRVVVFDGEREFFLFADLSSEGMPVPSVSKPSLLPGNLKTPVQTGKNLETFLQDEFGRLKDAPIYVAESRRREVIHEMTDIFSQGKAVLDFATFRGGAGEEEVQGMRVTADVRSMELQRGDVLLSVNGISLNSGEGWDDVLDVIQRAKWITYAFSRDDEVQVRFLEVR